LRAGVVFGLTPACLKKLRHGFESNRNIGNPVLIPSRRAHQRHGGFRRCGRLGGDKRRRIALKTTCVGRSPASIASLGNRSGDEDNGWPRGFHPMRLQCAPSALRNTLTRCFSSLSSNPPQISDPNTSTTTSPWRTMLRALRPGGLPTDHAQPATGCGVVRHGPRRELYRPHQPPASAPKEEEDNWSSTSSRTTAAVTVTTRTTLTTAPSGGAASLCFEVFSLNSGHFSIKLV
jgi:hypothetical protein